MAQLSEESLLLVENWETVEDILKAVDRLTAEVSSVLHSVESELVEQDWWEQGWYFVPYRDNQVYISREDWKLTKSYLIWIGVERFDPERLFGTPSPPQFYVWVLKKHSQLAAALAEAIAESEEDVLGEVDHTQSGYVVKHPVPKYLPGEIDGFEESVIRQIARFFAHWAQALSSFDEMIQHYIAGLKKKASAAGS
jgi:hypothetical protein